MKYTIYKTNTNLNNLRWWRNYDANHRNLPDTDIETYLSNKGITWVELKNTRNEPIKYETISKDSYDSIELYLPKLDEVPDYIKITYSLTDSKQESMYYYLEDVPSLYNAVNRLNAVVRYTLDKYVGFYKFHAYLKQSSVNPQMFFVRKHHPRMLQDSTTNKWYFDCNLQPWYKENKEEKQLIIVSKETYTPTLFSVMAAETKSATNHQWVVNAYEDLKAAITTSGTTATLNTFYTSTNDSVQVRDDLFLRLNESHANNLYYEYIITKPYIQGASKVDSKYVDKYFYWPINNSQGSTGTYFGLHNSLKNLWDNLTTIFTNDNIVGRIITNIPPSVLIMRKYPTLASGQTDKIDGTNLYTYRTSTLSLGAIICDGLPSQIDLPAYPFLTKITACLNNFNTAGTYNKTSVNNPHLFAPQNWQYNYMATSNNVITYTSDYIDFRQSGYKLEYDLIFSTEISARIITNKLNTRKLYSQAGNETTTSLNKQAPIESTAWNNTWIQRQTLDTARNATIKKDTTALIIGYFMTAIGGALASIFTGGLGTAGVMAALGGIGSIISGGVNLSNGLAQNEQAKKALYEQPNTINSPIGVSGLGSISNHTDTINFYTLGLSDNDIQIINSDDNMYGYKITSWLPYRDYLTCWDGNYMLCDMSKNYNNIFSKLKSIDSLWTLSDNYINQFIDALNNGITWFDGGNYVDLATDEYNWERTFARHL